MTFWFTFGVVGSRSVLILVHLFLYLNELFVILWGPLWICLPPFLCGSGVHLLCLQSSGGSEQGGHV